MAEISTLVLTPPVHSPALLRSVLPKASLYVGDLHPQVTEVDLILTFQKFGALFSVRVCRARASFKSICYGFVNFWNFSDVAKALSIQAHPYKELAAALHKSQPNFYKDANHKPEMALALTDFEALSGFISLEKLKGVVLNVPEIVEVVGKAFTDKFFDLSEVDIEGKAKEVVQQIFTELMSVEGDVIKAVLSKLITRLTSKDNGVDRQGKLSIAT